MSAKVLKSLGITCIIFFLIGFTIGEFTIDDSEVVNEKKAYQIIEEGLERVNR